MTQFDDRVEKQRLKLEAEEWANGIKCLHAHQIKSMWYDNRPQDTDESPVLDIQYNDGRIRRTINNTGEVVWMGEQIKGEELVHAYTRGGI